MTVKELKAKLDQCPDHLEVRGIQRVLVSRKQGVVVLEQTAEAKAKGMGEAFKQMADTVARAKRKGKR